MELTIQIFSNQTTNSISPKTSKMCIQIVQEQKRYVLDSTLDQTSMDKEEQ